MRRFIKKLGEPFPDQDSPKENLINIIGVGVFVTFFLYFFQVGGMHRTNGNVFKFCVHFGIITIIVALLYDLFIDKILRINRNDRSWTLLKWLFYMVGLLIILSIANYSYYVFISGEKSFSLFSFLMITLNTMMVGIFPVVFSGLLVQIKSQRKNQSQATDLQSHFPKTEIHHQVIQLFSSNKNQVFEAKMEHVLFIEAKQNYTSISFLKDGNVQKELLRNTISNIESQLDNTPLIRCHRSFMVNSDLIENVEGNAQGLRLDLKGLEETQVPVSRKYISILREKI